jgi:hypothetical protein
MAWRPDYITLDQLKDYKTIDDDVDDAELQTAISAASRAIDKATNRQFGKVDAPIARVYRAWFNCDRGRWVVSIDDLQSTSGLVVTIGGTVVTKYTLEPRNAVADGLAWTSLVLGLDAEAMPSSGDEYEVTAAAPWGWAAVPDAVVEACYIQSHRFANRRDSPYGVAGSPQQGSELRLLARLDPDVKVSLGLYVRPRAVG